jgi:periplasmic divalent cation tolerance protein
MKKKFIIIETTYPNSSKGKKLAKTLAQVLLDQKLAACLHFSEIESMYFWQKKLQTDQEILVKIKTQNSLFSKVKKIIEKHHSYENPQIISSLIDRGSTKYLEWIESNTKNNQN